MKVIRFVSVLLTVSICFLSISYISVAINNNDKEMNDETAINTVDMPDEEIFVDCNHDNLTSAVSINNEVYNDSIRNGHFEVKSDHDELIAAIKSSNDFTINGIITNGEDYVDIMDYYDFSQIDKYSIADWAFKNGLISYEDKIDCYCDLLLSRNFNHIFCVNNVIEEICMYQNTCQVDKKVCEKVDLVLSDFNSDDSQSNRSTTKSTANFYIEYMGSGAINLDPIANYLEQIRSEYHSLGFLYPRYNGTITDPSDPKYNKMYIRLYPGSGSTTGENIKVDIVGNKCASKIHIYNYSDNNIAKDVIDHEYFHAIQNAYNSQSSWFKEACANWGGMIIGADSICFDDHVNNFICNYCSSAPISNTNGYGASVYSLAIHRRDGGANAIKTIYENYSSQIVTSDVTQANSIIRSVITNSLSSQNDSFNNVYRAMCGYLLALCQ